MHKVEFRIKTDLPNHFFFLAYVAWNQKYIYCFCLVLSNCSPPCSVLFCFVFKHWHKRHWIQSTGDASPARCMNCTGSATYFPMATCASLWQTKRGPHTNVFIFAPHEGNRQQPPLELPANRLCTGTGVRCLQRSTAKSCCSPKMSCWSSIWAAALPKANASSVSHFCLQKCCSSKVNDFKTR